MPFKDLDRVRDAGGKWDFKARRWYVPEGADPAQFDRWRTADARKEAVSDRARASDGQHANHKMAQAFRDAVAEVDSRGRDVAPPLRDAILGGAGVAVGAGRSAQGPPIGMPSGGHIDWRYEDGAFRAVGEIAEYAILDAGSLREGARVEVREVGSANEPTILVDTARAVDALLIAEAFEGDRWDGLTIPAEGGLSPSARATLNLRERAATPAAARDIVLSRVERAGTAAPAALGAEPADAARSAEIPVRLIKALSNAFKEQGLRPVVAAATTADEDRRVVFKGDNERTSSIVVQVGQRNEYYGVNEVVSSRDTAGMDLHGTYRPGQEAELAALASRLAAGRDVTAPPPAVRETRRPSAAFALPEADQPLLVPDKALRSRVQDALVGVSNDRLLRMAEVSRAHMSANGDVKAAVDLGARLIVEEAAARGLEIPTTRTAPAAVPRENADLRDVPGPRDDKTARRPAAARRDRDQGR